MRPARSPVWPYALVAAIFLVSRVLARVLLELRFDMVPLLGYIQYVDPWFLLHDFWRTLLYLHHQAPLQNALVGVSLRWFAPNVAYQLIDATYVALGLGMVLGMLHAMLRLGAGPRVAVLTTTLFALTPATLLYENWLFYHVPVACCLVLSLVALIHYQRVGTLRAGVAFFGLIMTAALFRSTLGAVFLASALALLLIRPPPVAPSGIPARITALRAAAVPLCVLLLNAWKPSLLMGYGYGEALLWGNLSTKIHDQLRPFEQHLLSEDGMVTSGFGRYCIDDVECLQGLRVPHAPTGIPLLDLETTPNGYPNSHAMAHLLLARKYHKPDALFLLSHYPGAYLRSVAYALAENSASSTKDTMLVKTWNYHRLQRWDDALQKLCGKGRDDRLLLLQVGLPLLVVYAMGRVLRGRAQRQSQSNGTTAVAYVLLCIGYVTGVATGVSPGDFSRYRFEVDPLYVILLGLMLTDVQRATMGPLRTAAGWLRRSRARRSGSILSSKPGADASRV